MGISNIVSSGSLFGQAVQNLNKQLTDLSTQLATGQKSTTYSGMGINEGFAVAARAQLSNISAFGDTIKNVTTNINAANTALQSLSSIANSVQGDASTINASINSSGQTIAQENALSQLSSLVGILNTQVGDRFIFSGNAINTPAVASSDAILNGTATQAGLKQVIAERAQADGTTGLGRLAISGTTIAGVLPNTTGTFSVAETAAGSPFGLKLSSVQSTLTGATVTGPSGSPPSVSFSLGPTNPNPGDQVTLNFNLPDGTTASVQLTATNANPPPTGSFLIATTGGQPDPGATATNLNAALNTAIGTLANTTLVAASAVAAGHDFFDPSSSATGTVVNNRQAVPAPITAATALSGASGTNSIPSGFTNGDAITVDGTTITFSTSAATSLTGPTYNINPTTGTVGNLLSAIDSITRTTTPSSIDGGAVTLNTPNAANFSISAAATDPNAQAALAALGFGPAGTTITAIQPPLRVPSPASTATTLVNGSADTVAWYTGNNSPNPRASANALVDSSISVQYGIQANEQAIRQQVEAVAVFAAVTESPTAANAPQQIAALSERTAANMASQPGQQTVSDIQTDLANAQTTMQAASTRQSQTQTVLQNMISDTENVSTEQVASQILAVQNALSASYETTSILSKLTLTNFLAPGA